MDSPLQKILNVLASAAVVGQTGKTLDVLALSLIKTAGCEPAFFHYRPNGRELEYRYPATLCVSINNEVIHGIPDGRKFRWGDVVSLDLGLKDTRKNEEGDIVTEYDDGATTVIVGERAGSATARRLVKTTREALDAGCAAAKAGNKVFDISRAIKAVADREGFAIIKGYGGHGISDALHLPPFVPNEPIGLDAPLEVGMRLAIEPMFTTCSSGETFIASNCWTVKTRSGVCAHFERTTTIL